MRKVINGKVYDTETAEWIADYSYSYHGDFHWYEESLYRTKKGTYFLSGEGGGMSKYAAYSPAGGGYSAGSDLFLLTEQEARQWVEKYGGVDLYGELFGLEEG